VRLLALLLTLQDQLGGDRRGIFAEPVATVRLRLGESEGRAETPGKGGVDEEEGSRRIEPEHLQQQPHGPRKKHAVHDLTRRDKSYRQTSAF